MLTPTEKQCTLCKNVKPIDEFVSQVVEGYTNRCAGCRSRGQRAHRKYVKKNLDAIHAYQGEYFTKRRGETPREGFKICYRCLKELPLDQFPVGQRGARVRLCPSCREYQHNFAKEWRARNPTKMRVYTDRAIKRQREYRNQCLDHYGRKCACCGDEHVEFLTLDHADGNGGKHRAEIHPASIYSWLIRHNFPPNFRTLCFNCNWSFGAYGYCPHQKE